MRIVVIARTRNEKKNIGNFIRSYQWADQILVADGGSEDETVWLASQMNKTKVRSFDKKIELENGYWKNPAGEHLNFLIDWAENEGADVIIHDDVDGRTSAPLRNFSRSVFESVDYDMFYAVRLYLWGIESYFPALSQPIEDGRWEPSLWAWRANKGIRFDESNPLTQICNQQPKFEERYNFMTPNVLLHYGWPNEKIVKEKMDFYINSGQIPNMEHPLKFGGTLLPLPEWILL